MESCPEADYDSAEQARERHKGTQGYPGIQESDINGLILIWFNIWCVCIYIYICILYISNLRYYMYTAHTFVDSYLWRIRSACHAIKFYSKLNCPQGINKPPRAVAMIAAMRAVGRDVTSMWSAKLGTSMIP